jgi:hypothetical protein
MSLVRSVRQDTCKAKQENNHVPHAVSDSIKTLQDKSSVRDATPVGMALSKEVAKFARSANREHFKIKYPNPSVRNVRPEITMRKEARPPTVRAKCAPVGSTIQVLDPDVVSIHQSLFAHQEIIGKRMQTGVLAVIKASIYQI